MTLGNVIQWIMGKRQHSDNGITPWKSNQSQIIHRHTGD